MELLCNDFLFSLNQTIFRQKSEKKQLMHIDGRMWRDPAPHEVTIKKTETGKVMR